jgi:hypothetical protein
VSLGLWPHEVDALAAHQRLRHVLSGRIVRLPPSHANERERLARIAADLRAEKRRRAAARRAEKLAAEAAPRKEDPVRVRAGGGGPLQRRGPLVRGGAARPLQTESNGSEKNDRKKRTRRDRDGVAATAAIAASA